MAERRVPLKLPRPKLAPAIAIGVFGAALLLCAGWFSMTVDVGPDEFAIRQVYLGPSQGVQPEVIGPGYQIVVPGYERLHIFPRDLQALDMNGEQTTYASEHLTEDYTLAPPIRIQTSDGFQVTVDVTVMYRVVDPYTVLTKVGPGRLYETNVVVRRSDLVLRQTLGRLTAEGFYDDDERMAAEHDARVALTRDLEQWGLQVWGVLVRDYVYDERFQNQIEARKNEDQRKFKNQAETLRETRLAEKNARVAEMQMLIEQKRGEGDLAVRKIEADADLYHRKQVAEGDRALAVAQAEGSRLERLALEQAGASNLVGLEMAEALDGVEVIIVSTTGPDGVNPLDLDRMVQSW